MKETHLPVCSEAYERLTCQFAVKHMKETHLLPFFHFLYLSVREVSRVLMREGVSAFMVD